MTVAEVVFCLAFSAVGSAVVVRLCRWPWLFWVPVFAYVSLAGIAGGLAR